MAIKIHYLNIFFNTLDIILLNMTLNNDDIANTIIIASIISIIIVFMFSSINNSQLDQFATNPVGSMIDLINVGNTSSNRWIPLQQVTNCYALALDNFPAGLRVWLDAADTNYTTSTTINDKSGYGNAFAIIGGTYGLSNGTNGLNTITTTSTSKISLSTTWTPTTSPFGAGTTQIFVIKPVITTGTSYTLFTLPNITVSINVGVSITITWTISTTNAPQATSTVSNALLQSNINNPIIISFIDTNLTTGFIMYINGIYIASNLSLSSTSVIPTSTTLSIGSGFVGQFCEYQLYNNQLTSNDRTLVEYYLSLKWGIPMSSPPASASTFALLTNGNNWFLPNNPTPVVTNSVSNTIAGPIITLPTTIQNQNYSYIFNPTQQCIQQAYAAQCDSAGTNTLSVNRPNQTEINSGLSGWRNMASKRFKGLMGTTNLGATGVCDKISGTTYTPGSLQVISWN